MDLLTNDQIASAGLADWRKLAQGLHARYAVGSFVVGARFVAALADVGEAGHHPRVTLGDHHVDLVLLSADAVHRDDEGRVHLVDGVTQRDIDAAHRITSLAAEQGLVADAAGITSVEIALDTAHSATLSPVWAALLTGSTAASGHGSTNGDDVSDPLRRLPLMWFQQTDEHDTPRQRFHVDVWVPPEEAETRIAAAVAAGATVVDDSEAPSFTVLADPDGNKACVCTSLDRGSRPPEG